MHGITSGAFSSCFQKEPALGEDSQVSQDMETGGKSKEVLGPSGCEPVSKGPDPQFLPCKIQLRVRETRTA